MAVHRIWERYHNVNLPLSENPSTSTSLWTVWSGRPNVPKTIQALPMVTHSYWNLRARCCGQWHHWLKSEGIEKSRWTLRWKFNSCWLRLQVLESSVLAIGGKVLLTLYFLCILPTYQTTHVHWCQNGKYIMKVTNHFLIRFDTHPTS